MTVRDSDTLKSYFTLSKVITPANYVDLVDTIFAQSTIVGETGDHTHDSRYLQLSIANVVSAVHTFNPSTYSSPFILGAYAQGQTVVGLKADQLNRSISVSGLGLSGGGILNSDRNISLASSSNPGEAAAVLATNASGHLTLDQLAATDLSAQNVISNLIPSLTDTYDLGSSIKLWRKGWLSELDAILFAENTITLLGGWFIVGKDQGTIAVDVAAVDTTVDFGKAMTNGHFVVLRSSLIVEYMQIGTLVSGTRYNVTRNLDGTGANFWPAGSVFLVLGTTGSGRIELNAYDTPRIQIIEQGATYNAQTEVSRLGDLNGNWGYNGTEFGIAIGKYLSGYANLTWDPVSGLRIRSYTNTVIQLDNSGGAYFAGVMTIGTSGGVYQGTGTFWSPTTGLKIWNDSGIGRIAGYNASVLQWYADTDGVLYAGAGKIRISATGIAFTDTTTDVTRLRWYYSGRPIGYVAGDFGGTGEAVMWTLATKQAGDTWDAARVVLSAIDYTADPDTKARIDVLSTGEIDLEARTIVRSITGGSEYTTAGLLIPLTTPLTSTSWDGDSFSTTGKTVIDLSAVFGVPALIRAVLVKVTVNDSGSDATETYLILSPNNTSNSGLHVRCTGLANDAKTTQTIIVPCDANGDIYYQILASGASTLDVALQIWGYWL